MSNTARSIAGGDRRPLWSPKSASIKAINTVQMPISTPSTLLLTGTKRMCNRLAHRALMRR